MRYTLTRRRMFHLHDGGRLLVRFLAVMAVVFPTLAQADGPLLRTVSNRAVTMARLTENNSAGDRVVSTARATSAVCRQNEAGSVGANVGCIGPRGLYSGRSATSSIPNGAISLANYTATGGGTLTLSGDGTVRLTDNGATAGGMQSQAGPSAIASGASVYISCEQVRSVAGPKSIRLGAGGANTCTATVGDTSGRVGCALTAAASIAAPRAVVLFGAADADTGAVDVGGSCQVEATAAVIGPVVVCDGAAPCTRAADVPTIPTTGFPVTQGAVEVEVEGEGELKDGDWILDARTASSGSGFGLYMTTGRRLTFFIRNDSGLDVATATLGNARIYRGEWDAKEVRLYLDGELAATVANNGRTPTAIRSTMIIGGAIGGTAQPNAYIRNLSVWPQPRTDKAPAMKFEADLFHASDVLPCRAADGCAADCWAADDGAMVCRDGSGAVMSVTRGEGSTLEDTPWRNMAGRDLRAVGVSTTAAAPRITTHALQAFAGSNHTVIAVGASGAADGVLLSTGAGGGVTVRHLTARAECGWQGTSVRQDVSAGGPGVTPGEWRVSSCRRSGTTYTARSNGTQTSAAVTTAAVASTGPVFLGSGASASPMAGGLAHVRIYTRALSDAELEEYEARMWGAWAARPGTPILTTRATRAMCEDDEAVWHWVGPNMPCVTRRGLDSWGQVTNNALYSANIGSACTESSGGLTPNTDGSFRLTDSNSSGYNLFSCGTYGVTVGEWWTPTFEVRHVSGSAKVRVAWSGSAFGSFNEGCVLDVSTDEWRRVSCPKQAVGSDGAAQPRLYIGAASSDVGAVDIRQVQLEKSPTPGRRCDAGAAPTTCEADRHRVSSAGWPVERGRASFVYEPGLSPSLTYYLLDGRTPTGADGVGVSVNPNGSVGLAVRIGGVSYDTGGGVVSWSQWQKYRFDVEFSPARITVGRDGQIVAERALVMPLERHHTTFRIGSNYADSSFANGSIRNIRIY